jgi:hypothetical protein
LGVRCTRTHSGFVVAQPAPRTSGVARIRARGEQRISARHERVFREEKARADHLHR